MNYLEELEEDVKDLLLTLGIPEIAMLLFHRTWSTVDALCAMDQDPNLRQEFVSACRAQYYILRRPGMEHLDRLLDQFMIGVYEVSHSREMQ